MPRPVPKAPCQQHPIQSLILPEHKLVNPSVSCLTCKHLSHLARPSTTPLSTPLPPLSGRSTCSVVRHRHRPRSLKPGPCLTADETSQRPRRSLAPASRRPAREGGREGSTSEAPCHDSPEHLAPGNGSRHSTRVPSSNTRNLSRKYSICLQAVARAIAMNRAAPTYGCSSKSQSPQPRRLPFRPRVRIESIHD